jgi:hypothetical protein
MTFTGGSAGKPQSGVGGGRCRFHDVSDQSEVAMTRRRDPFTQALDSLRDRAEQGIFVPGQPVVIVDEARRLQLSTTPIREALAWLCGYGLIERAPMGGYLAPRLDPAVVRDRLTFRLYCLRASLEQASGTYDAVAASLEPDVFHRLYELMLRAVRRTGNAALVEEYHRVASQLHQLGQAERRLFRDHVGEAETLVALFEGTDRPALLDALTVYHQRRIEAAPLLVMEADAQRPALGEAR